MSIKQAQQNPTRLTAPSLADRIADAGNKSARQLNPVQSKFVISPAKGFFYSLKKNALLLRVFVLVARSGRPSGWPFHLHGVENPIRAAATSISILGRGYFTLANGDRNDQ